MRLLRTNRGSAADVARPFAALVTVRRPARRRARQPCRGRWKTRLIIGARARAAAPPPVVGRCVPARRGAIAEGECAVRSGRWASRRGAASVRRTPRIDCGRRIMPRHAPSGRLPAAPEAKASERQPSPGGGLAGPSGWSEEDCAQAQALAWVGGRYTDDEDCVGGLRRGDRRSRDLDTLPRDSPQSLAEVRPAWRCIFRIGTLIGLTCALF